MSYNKTILDFWKSQGLNHIKPNTGTEWPEGWDVRNLLVEKIGNESVTEVGCGYGRLCSKFTPDQYQGVDINPQAITEASNTYPQYTFLEYELDSMLSPSDWVLLYTVLLHVDDIDLVHFLETITANCNKVLIGEILGRKWRRKGNPPVFNREKEEYINVMEQIGFGTVTEDSRPYRRYIDTNVTFLEFWRDTVWP